VASASCNQVLYNLSRRGIEWDLLPWCRERHVPIMAYSPIEQGRVLEDRTLRRIANHHTVSPACVALAWVLRQDTVIAIPKAGTQAHVRENRAAVDVRLSEEDLAALDRAFPPPSGPVPLESL
jgi:diketogulonate reductase-like aldo/keto reductase